MYVTEKTICTCRMSCTAAALIVKRPNGFLCSPRAPCSPLFPRAGTSSQLSACDVRPPPACWALAIALVPRKCHPSSESVFDVLSPSPSLDKLRHTCGHGQHCNTGCCRLGVHDWRRTPRRPHLLSTSDHLLANAYFRL